MRGQPCELLSWSRRYEKEKCVEAPYRVQQTHLGAVVLEPGSKVAEGTTGTAAAGEIGIISSFRDGHFE